MPRPLAPAFRRWTLTLAASLSMVACATPTPLSSSSDPVDELLAERGLLSTPAPAEQPVEPAPEGASAVRASASELVVAAMNFLGVPYRRGGNSAEEGFDCSGFTRHIFGTSLGLVLPRRVDEQAKAPGLSSVEREQLQPGDLVFFNTLRRTYSHVGIYIGEGKFIHSPRSGAEVRIEDMRVAYWARRFTGARRASLLADDAPPHAGAALGPAAIDLNQP